MYKLVVVAGKLRGKEYTLEEGENVLGRDESCDVPFPVTGVSKRHMNITVTKDTAYVQDLGSSNGTFLNGKIVKRATVKNGDKIALPDTVLQVVFVKEKKKIVKKRVQKEEDETFDQVAPMPESLPGKIVWMFKYKLMPVFHGINEEYEWRILLGILMTIFIVIVITLTIFPALQDSKKILLIETAKRGAHYAEEIERINFNKLSNAEDFHKIDTAFLDKEDGVKQYVLFKGDGVIIRPLDRINQHINDTFFVKVRDWAEKNKNKQNVDIVKIMLPNNEIGIGKRIRAYDPRTGGQKTVGALAMKFAPTSLKEEATKSSKAYLEALVTSMIVAIFFFSIVYYLTIKPLEEMKFQIEEALRGKRRNIDSNFLFEEMNPLRASINSILQRIRELQSEDDSEFAEMEGDESYVSSLKEFMLGAGVPVMVLNSQKALQAINTDAEDITGIRESSAEGMDLVDCCREKGFAATIIELCDDSANNGGTNQSGEYELQGDNFGIHVTSLLGKDNFAKAFYVTFIRE